MSNLQPIRVLHIITRLIVGGAQENTLLSVEGLDRLAEYEVTLVTGVDNGPEGDLLGRARRTTRLVIVPELGRSINPLSDVVAFYKLYRVIRTGRYHIVHTHSRRECSVVWQRSLPERRSSCTHFTALSSTTISPGWSIGSGGQ